MHAPELGDRLVLGDADMQTVSLRRVDNSCRRRLAQGANESFSDTTRPFSLNRFFLQQ